jgi:hypothetical protein
LNNQNNCTCHIILFQTIEIKLNNSTNGQRARSDGQAEKKDCPWGKLLPSVSVGDVNG